MNKKDQEFIVQKIRSEYTEKEHSQLDELKKLDREVKRPVQVLAYGIGTIGALVLGTGMSLAMGMIGKSKISGVLIGCAGIGIVSGNYSLYKKVLKARKEEYADKILELSDRITEESQPEFEEK